MVSGLLEVRAGVTSYIDYPAVSVLADAADSYSAIRESIVIGRRHGSFMYGLKVLYQDNMSTSSLETQERMSYSAFSLSIRDYESLGAKLECFFWHPSRFFVHAK